MTESTGLGAVVAVAGSVHNWPQARPQDSKRALATPWHPARLPLAGAWGGLGAYLAADDGMSRIGRPERAAVCRNASDLVIKSSVHSSAASPGPSCPLPRHILPQAGPALSHLFPSPPCHARLRPPARPPQPGALARSPRWGCRRSLPQTAWRAGHHPDVPQELPALERHRPRCLDAQQQARHRAQVRHRQRVLQASVGLQPVSCNAICVQTKS